MDFSTIISRISIVGLVSVPESIYAITLCFIFISLVFYRFVTHFAVMFIKSSLLSSTIRPFILRHIIYAYSLGRVLGNWSISRLHLIMACLYLILTGICNIIDVSSVKEAGARAARLSLINLLPMFLGGGYETGARLLGVSLQTYGFFHQTIGFVAFVEALAHIIIIAQATVIKWSDNVEFYGLLTGCMFLALSILPFIRKRVYEIFILTHTGCALTMIYGIWCHVKSEDGNLSSFPIVYLCIFAITRTIQISRIIYRNIVIGRVPVRLTLHPFVGNVARITLSVPRPWTVRAGERINLGVPHVGIFYSFQAHPFAISWWEENDKGRAVSISFLVRPRSGFTKKLLERIKPNRECGAWVDGPFGATSIDWRSSTSAGDYGQIFMIATGIGIAAQLPYIKEVLDGHDKAQVCTQRISLIWQIDEIGDWESVRDWLQALVKQDNGYMLHVSVYDQLRQEKEVQRIGENGLIEVHSGVVDWEEKFNIETQSHIGRLLVTVSAQSQVRRDIRDLVRTRVDGMITLFEPEFQPWGQTASLRSYLKP